MASFPFTWGTGSAFPANAFTSTFNSGNFLQPQGEFFPPLTSSFPGAQAFQPPLPLTAVQYVPPQQLPSFPAQTLPALPAPLPKPSNATPSTKEKRAMVIELRRKFPSMTLRAIAAEAGYVSASAVKKILDGDVRLDAAGRGRPPTLSAPLAHAVMTHAQHLLVDTGSLSTGQVKEIAQVAYFSQPAEERSLTKGALPKFDSKFRQALNKRFPALSIKRAKSAPAEPRRKAAKTRRGVESAIMGQRHQLLEIKASMGGDSFGVPASFVFVADETKIDIGQYEPDGKPSLRVGKCHPMHTVHPHATHMSDLAFVSLSGEVVTNVIFIQGKPSAPNKPLPLGANTRSMMSDLVYCNGGGADGYQDGLGGSYAAAIDAFIRACDARFGKFRVARQHWLLLIVDGLMAHCQVEIVDKLVQNGIHCMILSANLTSAVQVHDNTHMLGIFKNQLRQQTHALQDMFPNLGLMEWLAEVEKIVKGVMGSRANVAKAAYDCGWSYNSDGTKVTITQEGATAVCDRLQHEGKLTSQASQSLRSAEYLEYLDLVKHRGYTHVSFASLSAFDALEKAKNKMVSRVESRRLEKKKDARAKRLRLTDSTYAEGTRLLSAAEYHEGRVAMLEEKNESTTSNGDRAKRLAELKAAPQLQSVDAAQYKTNVGRYLKGANEKYDLAWAVAHVLKCDKAAKKKAADAAKTQ
jgi:hypothetical protein